MNKIAEEIEAIIFNDIKASSSSNRSFVLQDNLHDCLLADSCFSKL